MWSCRGWTDIHDLGRGPEESIVETVNRKRPLAGRLPRGSSRSCFPGLRLPPPVCSAGAARDVRGA